MYTIVYQMMLYPINNVRRWMVPLSIITLHNLTGMKHNHQSELQHQCVITQNHVLQMWDEGIQVIRFHPLIGPMSQKFFVKVVGLSPSFETLDSIRNFDHVQEVSLERPMCYLLWCNLAFLVKLFFRTLADSTVLEMAPLDEMAQDIFKSDDGDETKLRGGTRWSCSRFVNNPRRMSQKFFVKVVGLSPSFETLDSIRNFDHVQEVSLERPMCYLLWCNLAFLVKLFFRCTEHVKYGLFKSR
ncbi:serine/threonine-protein phosphatase PP2A-3 catalytic subunit [Artemisia annua]|uniref:Serine/threonine-protein phosphatase PP2A-3 catalytic subunit n=1 Tax=Artemisia annua TaxID=35608 RepID=A0A2U1L8S5_ARTAN|nr:serine/threonine-protein phosphatase PP2A-3 catalytic subunit [Artemisia annua]